MWHSPPSVKYHNIFVYQKRYLDEAEREKLQYAQELKEYQETEAYQITSAKINDKRIKKGDSWPHVNYVYILLIYCIFISYFS